MSRLLKGRYISEAKFIHEYICGCMQNESTIVAYECLKGKCFEIIEKENPEDGSRAKICRYVWEDASVIA